MHVSQPAGLPEPHSSSHKGAGLRQVLASLVFTFLFVLGRGGRCSGRPDSGKLACISRILGGVFMRGSAAYTMRARVQIFPISFVHEYFPWHCFGDHETLYNGSQVRSTAAWGSGRRQSSVVQILVWSFGSGPREGRGNHQAAFSFVFRNSLVVVFHLE